LSSLALKNILFFRTSKSVYIDSISSHSEGRLAIVTDAGRDAVDARQRADEALFLADGEVVWS
jgi:hypothetical protein